MSSQPSLARYEYPHNPGYLDAHPLVREYFGEQLRFTFGNLISTRSRCSTFPNSPKLLKGGLALLDAGSSRILRVIALQYNPDSLSRALQVRGFGESGDQRLSLFTPCRSPGALACFKHKLQILPCCR
jgi:hypothetical protein